MEVHSLIILASNPGCCPSRSAFARVFALTFDLDVGDGAPPVTPPMPEDGGAWAFMTYFVMTTESFVEYTRLFRCDCET